jgi:uncharacterized protein (TIGR02246 family)
MPQKEQAKKDVVSAFVDWREALASRNPDRIVNLYSEHAVLLATLEPRPLVTQTERKGYFSQLMVNPNLHVEVDEEHCKALADDHAVISGLYTFVYDQNNATQHIPARFSFVYEKRDDKWHIIAHHSSRIPS